MLEGFGIGQRLEVLHLPAVDDVTDGELDDLATLGSRHVRHLNDPCRNMPRCRVFANAFAHAVLEGRRQLQIVAEAHEQYDPLVVVPVLPDDQALQDLIELFHLAVDLRRPDAHTTGIEHRV